MNWNLKLLVPTQQMELAYICNLIENLDGHNNVLLLLGGGGGGLALPFDDETNNLIKGE